MAAIQKFIEVEGTLKKNSGGGGKMMIPVAFDKDIIEWRKWKAEVTKPFDEEQEGMQNVIDAVSIL